MPITVNCACGQSMRVKDEWAGRRARCPMCKQPLTVPSPPRGPAEEDDEVIAAVPAEEESDTRVIPKPKPRPKPRPEPVEDRPRRRVRDEEDEEVYEADPVEEERPSRVTTKPKTRPMLERENDADDRPRRRRDEEDEDDGRDARQARSSPRRDEEPATRSRRKTTSSGGGFGTINAGALGGVGMMLIAVVWFVLGLYADRIYIYPPILFVLGLVAVIRGLMGGKG